MHVLDSVTRGATQRDLPFSRNSKQITSRLSMRYARSFAQSLLYTRHD